MGLLTKTRSEIIAEQNYCPEEGVWPCAFAEWQGMTTKKTNQPMVKWTFKIRSDDDEKADGYTLYEYTVADVDDPDKSFGFPPLLAAVLPAEVFNALTDEDIKPSAIRNQEIPALDEAIGTVVPLRLIVDKSADKKRLRIASPVFKDSDEDAL